MAGQRRQAYPFSRAARTGRKHPAVAVAVGCALAGPGVGHARQDRALTQPTINGAGNITVAATFGCGESFCATVDETYGLTATEPGYTSDQITIT